MSAFASDARNVVAVDTHVHVFRRGLPLALERRYVPDYDAEPERLENMLTAHGTTHAVLVQPSFLGQDNRFLVDTLQTRPSRYRGVAVVGHDVDDETLNSLVTAGVVGVRLNVIDRPLPDLRLAGWRRCLRALNASLLHVDLHCESRDLSTLLPPLLDAGLDVVVDHFGRPAPQVEASCPGFATLLHAAATGHVWVKLSGWYRLGDADRGAALAMATIPRLRDAFGTSRLLWGSDWPHTQFEEVVDYDAARAQLHCWLPNEHDRHAVLVETPATLYGFGPSRANSGDERASKELPERVDDSLR